MYQFGGGKFHPLTSFIILLCRTTIARTRVVAVFFCSLLLSACTKDCSKFDLQIAQLDSLEQLELSLFPPIDSLAPAMPADFRPTQNHSEKDLLFEMLSELPEEHPLHSNYTRILQLNEEYDSLFKEFAKEEGFKKYYEDCLLEKRKIF